MPARLVLTRDLSAHGDPLIGLTISETGRPALPQTANIIVWLPAHAAHGSHRLGSPVQSQDGLPSAKF